MILYKTEEKLDVGIGRGIDVTKRFEGNNGVNVEITYNTDDFDPWKWAESVVRSSIINAGYGPKEIIEVDIVTGFKGGKMPTKDLKGFSGQFIIDNFCSYPYRIKYDIRHIYHNNTKNVTVVVWETGDKTKVKLADGETSNIYNAVAAAVMKRKYGSNSAFKSYIKKNCGRYGDAIYQVIAREQVGVIYGGYEAFKQMVDEKLILQG